MATFCIRINFVPSLLEHLFDEHGETGHPVFGASMSRSRFRFLVGCLSLDNKATRAGEKTALLQ